MTDHAEKNRELILSSPAPRTIEWDHFVAMWNQYADKVENESGDHLAVDMHGHRVVFHRPHDGVVGIEDIERARHLLKSAPASTEGRGRVLTITLDDKGARFYDFDLDAHDVEVSGHKHESNPDPHGRHMRTVEKKTGRDDKEALDRFFDDLVSTLKGEFLNRRFVLLGHGTGTSNVAELFDGFLRTHDSEIHDLVIATGVIDLSAATEADLETKAKELAGQG